ncbi:MAG: DUF4399 domain-containing protein [Alphaproteobacteria bacterium]|nr:MAG: DUF4399 domain-containing protein [Alphaproteobacteria bacterium]
MNPRIVVLTAVVVALSVIGLVKFPFAGEEEALAAPGPQVYFIAPADSEKVTGPVRVVFGLKGMGVAPAGTDKPGTGHHHLLIDRPPLSEDELKESLPADEHIKHFGGGQTETELELTPGTHTLQLVFGDMNHVPFDPPVMSAVITIIVE